MSYDRSADTRSLYIHWPFCPYKCHFCPFVALAGHDSFMEAYHRALIKEIGESTALNDGQEIKTVFIGGGTPSTYPVPLLLDMFGTLRKRFAVDQQAEISIEVNPGTVKDGMLESWRDMGINRLSIGVQSLNDKVLRNLNRHQSAEDVYGLVHQASALFENISIDLIMGLPEVSSHEWQDLINQVVSWPVKHVSVYFLTIHENTPLYFRVQQHKVDLPSDEALIELYHWTVDTLKTAGFEQYELSNFARPGFHSRHNSVYWDRKPYKGFGLGACSFDGSCRSQNEKNLMKYLQKVETGSAIEISTEQLSPEQARLELLMLGLRRSAGLAIAQLMGPLNDAQRVKCSMLVADYLKRGWLEQQGETIRLSSQGLLLENEIVVQIARIE